MYRERGSLLSIRLFEFGLSLCVQGTRIGWLSDEFGIPVYPCVYRERGSVSMSSTLLSGLSLCVQGTPNYNILFYN